MFRNRAITSGGTRPRALGPPPDVALIEVIKHHFTALAGNPGVRRMRAELAATGHRVGHKRVWRLMRAAGLQGRHPKAWKRTTVPGERPVPAPDLIGRDFTAQRANQKWCGDITYIKTWNGWAYLATVIDLYSRKVVGWALDTHMRTDLVTDALTMAITHRRPRSKVIFHSDRGTQYKRNTHRRISPSSVRRIVSVDPWGGRGSVSTMLSPKVSSPLTRKN